MGLKELLKQDAKTSATNVSDTTTKKIYTGPYQAATMTTSTTINGGSFIGTGTSTFYVCTSCGMTYTGAGHICLSKYSGMLGSSGIGIGGLGSGYGYAQYTQPVLPRYHKDVKCSKCQNTSPTVAYCDGSGTTFKSNPCTSLVFGEHMHLTCNKCTYQWLMHTADKELPEDSEESL